MADDSGPKDLFGDPWTPPRDPRGRKRHKRTAELAETVGVLRGNGRTEEEIATYIGLSVPTLRKYYFRELDLGPVLAEAELDSMIWKRAKAGSVPAMKLLKDAFAKGRAAVPLKKGLAKGGATEPLGKKAQADADAKTAHEGTGWGGLLQ